MPEDQNLFTFASTQEQLDKFLASYHPEKIMIPPDEPLRNFKARHLRVCRFCNQPAGTKKFKSAAHVIPQFLGNKHLQSDFECDDCNRLFSKNETDLAAWFGMSRSVLGTAGKEGVPTFKSPNEMITARLTNFFNTKATKISTPNPESGAINFDEQSGKTVITYVKDTYTPIRVYKSLLKMALSMIDPNEVGQYRPAFNFLLSNLPNPWFDEFAKVICHILPLEHRFGKPVGLMFKKNDPLAKLPMHAFALYYETYILAFPMPINQLDWNAGLYRDLKMDFYFPPPIVFHKPHAESKHFSHNLDLSGYDKVIGEEGTLSFEMKPEDMKNMMSFDPKTGISKPGVINPGEIVGVIIAAEGTTIKTDRIYENPF